MCVALELCLHAVFLTVATVFFCFLLLFCSFLPPPPHVQYKMSRSELRTKTLWVSVWDNARLGHNTFLGEVRLVLSNVDFLRQDADVFELQEKVRLF